MANVCTRDIERNKRLLCITICVIIQLTATAQTKIGAELYKYVKTGLSGSVQPLFHIQTANNWYGELRYNYEDAKTLSLYGGKTFEGGNDLEYDITPMIGYSAGRFKGVSFAFNANAEWKNFFLSSQTQYSKATKKNTGSFFFSWSELGYNIGDYFFAGLSMQSTIQVGKNYFEPGFLAGLNFENISFPFYVFNPFQSQRYFVLGVCYEFSFQRKDKRLGCYRFPLTGK